MVRLACGCGEDLTPARFKCGWEEYTLHDDKKSFCC